MITADKNLQTVTKCSMIIMTWRNIWPICASQNDGACKQTKDRRTYFS